MEEVYSFIPIWGWHPLLVGLFVLGIDWGVIMAIRRVTEGKWYWGRWWSFRVGDTIGLPLYAAAAAWVVEDYHSEAFHQQIWWHALWLSIGIGLSLFFQARGLLTGFFNRATIFNPSEMYHTVIFGLMFYLMLTIAPSALTNHNPSEAFLLAVVGIGIYVFCYALDQTSLVDKSPDRRPAFWECWPFRR